MKRKIPWLRRLQNKVSLFDRGPNTYYGDRAETYVLDRQEDSRWGREDEIVTEALSRLTPRPKILDIPVGTGRFFEQLSSMQAEVTAIDISKDMLRIARASAARHESANTSFKMSAAHKTQMGTGHFDAILSIRFIGMLRPRYAQRVLREFRRVLKRNGTLVLYFPIGQENVPAQIVNHVSDMTPGQFYGMMEGVGFKALSVHPAGSNSVHDYFIAEFQRS